jgi:hypothetical protein
MAMTDPEPIPVRDWRDSCKDEKDAARETNFAKWLMWKSAKYHKMADLLLDKPLECMVIEGKRKCDETMNFVPEWRSHVSVDNLLFLIIQTLRTRCAYLKIKVPFRVELHSNSVVTRHGGLVKVLGSRFDCKCVIKVMRCLKLSRKDCRNLNLKLKLICVNRMRNLCLKKS